MCIRDRFKKKKKGDGSQPRKKSRSAGANDAPDNSGDNDALRPLPSGTRVLAVDVNQGGFAFGCMTQRVQTRVASVLAGTDAVDEDEWPPDKRRIWPPLGDWPDGAFCDLRAPTREGAW